MTQTSQPFENSQWTYQRQKDLWDILSPKSVVWSTEIMHNVPQSLSDYPQDWLESLKSLSENELWTLDAKLLTGELQKKLPKTQYEWLQNLRRLEKVPAIDLQACPPAPAEIYFGMRTKKQYEVQRLGSFVKSRRNLLSEKKSPWILDIGGGSGHLLRYLTYQGQAQKYFCLDASLENLNFGKLKWKRISDKLSKVTFPWAEGIQYEAIHTFLPAHPDAALMKNTLPAEIKKEAGFIIGLHTCGPLALGQTQLAKNIPNQGFINLPCCYHKLDNQLDVNLSQFTRQQTPLSWNTFAFTLATRSHGNFTLDNYLNKRRVKFFRYGIHLLFMEFFGRSDIFQVHEAPLKMYFGEFSTYANSKLKELGFTQLPEQKINQFFNHQKTQDMIQAMFHANLYRWQFGRTLELSLLLDRVHWMREQGLDCQIGELFEESLSPRNLVLYF